MSLGHKQTPYFFNNHINIILLFHLVSLQSGTTPSRSSDHIFYAYSSPLRATYPMNLIALDLMILIILGEAYKLQISMYFNFFQPFCASPPF